MPGDNQSDIVKRTLTLAMIAEKYPEEGWIQAYTDGSATDAVSNGGAGTGQHIIQDCPLYHQLRMTTWPTETPLHTKLYGPQRELERTADFMPEN
nr:hypothetical protein BaRGS_016866 [Batillaria attramentaria]